jgi:hypothetical protein
MNANEREIYYYLKPRRREFFTVREIGRRAGGKRRFRVSPDWARSVLLAMAERGILESDAEGRYRLKPIPKTETEGRRWASPEIANLLKKSGKPFHNLMTSDAEDEYYDKL